MKELPFTLETELERRIAADPAWQKGIIWGKPRTGHLEGPVMYHIADVLANIDKQRVTPQERSALRLIALIHDTFKYRVDEHQPKVGHNRHGYLARLFACHYIAEPIIVEIIELHDEAYHCWRLGMRKGKWQQAEERIDTLLAHLMQYPQTDRKKRENLLPLPTRPDIGNFNRAMPTMPGDFAPGTSVSLYVRFFYADSETESKDPAPIIWFTQLLKRKGYRLPEEHWQES